MRSRSDELPPSRLPRATGALFHLLALLVLAVPYVMRIRRQPVAWAVFALLGVPPSLRRHRGDRPVCRLGVPAVVRRSRRVHQLVAHPRSGLPRRLRLGVGAAPSWWSGTPGSVSVLDADVRHGR